MKTTAAFKALKARDASRLNDAGSFSIRGILKSGGIAKTCHASQRGQTIFTREDADKIAANLNKLNPGKTFVVVAAE
jgi:hypothetical protein